MGKSGRYTVTYDGYLFCGDRDGFNSHDMDEWSDVAGIIGCYGDMISVRDNETGACFANGIWT